MRSPAISLLIATEILLSSTWAAVAQRTCRVLCPDGSMSEVIVCNSNQPPSCLRAPPGPGAGFVAPPPQVTVFSQELSAYSDLVNRFNREDYGFLAKDLATPRNSNEMSEGLLRLNRSLDLVAEFTNGLLDNATYDRDHIQTIDGEIAAMDKEVKEIQHRNAYMHDYVHAARDEYGLLSYYSKDQQWLAIDWLDYVRPRDFPIHYIDDPKIRSVTLPPIDIPAAREYVEPFASALRPSHPRMHAAKTIIDRYSNLEKISHIGQSFDYLLSADRQLKQVNREFDPKLLKLLSEKESKLDKLKRLRDKGIFESQQWLKQVPAVQTNFVVAAVEALAWKTYTGHVAVREAKAFYDLNKSWYQLGEINDDTRRRALKAGKMALSVLSSNAEDVKGFLDVQDRTLGLLGDAQRFMSEAPEIIVNGTPEDMQSLLKGMNNKQSDFNLEVMEAAKRGLGSYTPFAQAMMGADVPVPYQGLAKKLGLTKILGIGD
jgi:hypothetical protein